ncbi:MAG: PhoH family protein [Planctomycetota bacterium]
MVNKLVPYTSLEEVEILFGPMDSNIKLIKKIYNVKIALANGKIKIKGNKSDVMKAYNMIHSFLNKIRDGKIITPEDILGMHDNKQTMKSEKDTGDKIEIKNLTEGQKKYIESINNYVITVCIGPAGTGKTFLAVAQALNFLHEKKVKRIVISRPVVEAGEKLGFLPGTFQQKVNPYLKPIYDAISSLLNPMQLRKLLELEIVEIVPLAYMRGRTLDYAFIILDEAQNTTLEQLKMFLTRIGNHSHVIINGDITQIDLEKGKKSGLVQLEGILRDVSGINFVTLHKSDIVRHPLVQKIVDAFERIENKKD